MKFIGKGGRRVRNRIFLTGLSILMLLSWTTPVLANPALFQQRDELREERNQINDEIEDLEQDIQKLDNDISMLVVETEDVQNEIENKHTQISKYEDEIEAILEQSEEEQDMYHGRLRGMYIQGNSSYLEVLLGSTNVADMLNKVNAVQSVMKHDTEVLETFANQRMAIEDKVAKINDEKDELVLLEEELEVKMNEIEVAMREQQSNLEMLEATRSDIVAEISTLNDEIALLSNGSGGSGGPNINPSVPSGLTGSNVVSYAMNFLGTPYVYGGSTPAGFDCSGFTSYVYKQFGVDIGRTTYDQVKRGTVVSKANLQPGDLVFFGSKTSPYHVGIYVGGGQYIHSPRTGDVIKVAPIQGSTYATARRIIN